MQTQMYRIDWHNTILQSSYPVGIVIYSTKQGRSRESLRANRYPTIGADKVHGQPSKSPVVALRKQLYFWF